MDEEMEMDCSSETKETKQRQRKPRNHAGPLPEAVYELFLSSVRAKKLNKTQYPSGPDLKAIGFPKPKGGHTRRERFKHWSARMDITYDPDSKTERLLHSRTGKMIIPLEEFENVIRKVHENGGGQHCNLKKTMNNVQEKYTLGGRDFGMNRGVIRYVVDTCQECIIDYAIIKSNNGKNGLTSSTPICNGLLAPESCSMVAHVPNTACIWFDKSVLVSSSELYPKLSSLISEMRGELPGIAKGNKDAKGRFLIKLYTTVEFIRSQQVKTSYQATEPYSHQMHEDLVKLHSVYEQENIEHQFLSDMDLLMEVYRTAGHSDYFLRSLQASISLVCQSQPEILKQQVNHTNGLTLDFRDGIKYLPHGT